MDIAEFLKNPKSSKISERIKHFSQQLKDLVSLEISAQDIPGETSFILYFILISFLQDAHNLENLTIKISPSPKKSTKTNAFSLPNIISFFPETFTKLKSFTLELPRSSPLNFENENTLQKIAMPQLRSFALTARLSPGEKTLKKILMAFSDHPTSINSLTV